MLALGALAIPFLVLSLYLAVSRWPSRWFTATSDYAAISVSALVGGALIWQMPFRQPIRVAAIVIAVPVLAVLLFYFAFFFVGAVFGDWL